MGEEVDIELVSYRPTRRAVVKILPHRSEHPIFGKVVEPRQVSGVVSRMQMLERAGVPAPRLVRFDEQGLVVSSALPGMPLNKVYASVVPENLARMRTVLDSLAQTLDSLPLVSLGLPARPAWADRCEHYAQAAAIALPEHEQRATRLAHQIREILSSADMGPVQPTHGDFYEANILSIRVAARSLEFSTSII